jgi:hypothetical protein
VVGIGHFQEGGLEAFDVLLLQGDLQANGIAVTRGVGVFPSCFVSLVFLLGSDTGNKPCGTVDSFSKTSAATEEDRSETTASTAPRLRSDENMSPPVNGQIEENGWGGK